jgi:F-type H+-transporting ATPase subunit b
VSKILVGLITITSFAFASSGAAEHGTDIVQRTVNFILFAGLLWYLLAKPVKEFFTGRSESISNELQAVQNKLNESVERKKEALAKVSEAEKQAADILEAMKKESKILNDSIMAQCEQDLETLEKAHESKLELEERKMINSVVTEVLEEVIAQSSEEFNKDAMVNVILKKVA